MRPKMKNGMLPTGSPVVPHTKGPRVVPILLLAGFVGIVGWFVWLYGQIHFYATHDEARPADAITVFGAAEYDGRPSPVLRARLDQNALHVTVSDTGPGFRPPGGEKSGVGLENVTRRLQLCYGAESQIQIQSGAGGSSVSFSIPVNVAASRPVEAVL